MREKELRLALVCYGGISLAVYMHGITKEVGHLVRASRAYHAGDAPQGGSEAVYAALIAEIEALAGIRLRVLADIIAGASAGGINGIFLAQAITTGQSLEPLTDLWLTSADVEALIDPDAAPASRFSKLWALPLAWVAAGRSKDKVEALDDATQDEVCAPSSRTSSARAGSNRRSAAPPSPACCSTPSRRWPTRRRERDCCPMASPSTCSSPARTSPATPNACA